MSATTVLVTGRTCERCGYWAQTLECGRERETGECCEREPLVSLVAAPWSAPDVASRVCEVFPLPAPTPRKARVVKPRAAPADLVGVAAWWAQVPASLLAKDRQWGETTSSRGVPFKPWSAEQEARMHAKDKEAEYVALGHSAEWARWYCGPLVDGFNGGRKAVSRREEYALFVSSAGGPALDKIAKKLSPRKR